jgi:ribonuclease HII
MPCDLRHERALHAQGILRVAGIDEAGRGPLAGPVVVAAVVLPPDYAHPTLNDSKQLTHARREKIFEEILADPRIAWARVIMDHAEIDRLNILEATIEGMRRAALQLVPQPEHVLIDGRPVRPFPLPQTALVKGDAQSLSIAAASVIAKVTRDRLMLEFDARFPQYGFAQHKGYGTALHLQKLREHGPCEIHRKTFAPVAQLAFGF